MNFLDMMSGSVLGAPGCNMDAFLSYFPAAETMYTIFIALGMGFLLLICLVVVVILAWKFLWMTTLAYL